MLLLCGRGSGRSAHKRTTSAIKVFGQILLFADAEVERLLMDKVLVNTDDMGRRMWSCGVCDYSRKLKNDVVKHVERRHLNLELFCSLCPSSFKSRNDLKVHMTGHQLDNQHRM